MKLPTARDALKLSEANAKDMMSEPYNRIMDKVYESISNAVAKGTTNTSFVLCDFKPNEQHTYEQLDYKVLLLVQKEVNAHGYTFSFNWNEYESSVATPVYYPPSMGGTAAQYIGGIQYGSSGISTVSYPKADAGVRVNLDWSYPMDKTSRGY